MDFHELPGCYSEVYQYSSFLTRTICTLPRSYTYFRKPCPPAVVSGRLNVVKGLKRTNQIVSFRRSPHMIKLWTIPVRIYLARNHSKYFEWKLLREPHHKHLQYPSTSRKCLKSKKLVDPCPDRCSSSRSRPAAEKDNGFQGSRYRYRHTFWHLCRRLARLPFRFMNSGSWEACGAVSMYFPWQFICRKFPSLENRITSWMEFQASTPKHAVAAQLATEARSAVTWIKVLIS